MKSAILLEAALHRRHALMRCVRAHVRARARAPCRNLRRAWREGGRDVQSSAYPPPVRTTCTLAPSPRSYPATRALATTYSTSMSSRSSSSSCEARAAARGERGGRGSPGRARGLIERGRCGATEQRQRSERESRVQNSSPAPAARMRVVVFMNELITTTREFHSYNFHHMAHRWRLLLRGSRHSQIRIFHSSPLSFLISNFFGASAPFGKTRGPTTQGLHQPATPVRWTRRRVTTCASSIRESKSQAPSSSASVHTFVYSPRTVERLFGRS